MSMVFERYPNGGGEMLLALALADHAHDDGSNIYPSIQLLAFKTRQSVRAVQYQLRRMEQTGWLELVNSGNGGRNQHREYRIKLAWIKGEEIAPIKISDDDHLNDADIAPLKNEKGATDDTKGCNSEHERVQSTTLKGAKLLHPHITVSEPSVKPSLEPGSVPIPGASTDQPLPPTQHPNGIFPMFIDWRPGPRFCDSLRLASLTECLWEDDLPEFILYRLGKSEVMSQGSWEHRFIQRLKVNEVARSRSGNEPTRLPLNWRPDRMISSALLSNGITQKFLDDALLEFNAFWCEDGSFARSWSAKFIQHVQLKWSQRQPERVSAFESLTDRSWAAGLVPGIENDPEIPP